MSDFVYGYAGAALIPGDDAGTGEGVDRVFHTAVGEAAGQYADVVFSPLVRK
jgi:hypothetical protein